MTDIIAAVTGLLCGILVAVGVLALGVLWVALELRAARLGHIVRPAQTNSHLYDRDRTDYV